MDTAEGGNGADPRVAVDLWQGAVLRLGLGDHRDGQAHVGLVLDRGAGDLAIALGDVRIAKRQQSAVDVQGQNERVGRPNQGQIDVAQEVGALEVG